jgi:anti-sigma factor RsiW
MADQPPLNDEERADLVAYLDGQLDDERARDVAARLSLDARARTEADELNRVWDLLDYLPRPEPSPTFTHRTLERVSVVRTGAPVVRRRRRWAVAAGWAAGLLLVAAAGFGGVVFLVPRDHTDEDLARDLRVLENKRLYDAVDDMDFLWELSRPDLFGDDSAGG